MAAADGYDSAGAIEGMKGGWEGEEIRQDKSLINPLESVVGCQHPGWKVGGIHQELSWTGVSAVEIVRCSLTLTFFKGF